MAKSKPSVFDRLFRNSQGEIVVGQRPNRSITIWTFSIISGAIIGDRNRELADVLFVIADVAIIVWASMELLKGDSLFRRLLGLVVLILVIINRIA